jgi:hypothetical protein
MQEIKGSKLIKPPHQIPEGEKGNASSILAR